MEKVYSLAASEHNQPAMWVFPSPEGITRDVASKMAATPRIVTLVLTGAGLLFVLGIIGFVARAVDDGFDDYAQIVDVADRLQARGYSEQDVRKIFGENFLRVFGEVFG